jgi:hypothetical protein
MNAKSFCKNALILILVLTGVFYVASAFFVSKTVSQAFYNPRSEIEDALSRIEFVVRQEGVNVATLDGNLNQETASQFHSQPNSGKGETVSIVMKKSPKMKLVLRFIRGTIQWVLFVVLLALPIGIAYRFLVSPLKEFPLVSSEVLSNVALDDDVKKEAAATVIIKAMILSGKERLAKLTTDDEVRGDLEEDIDRLESAMRFPVGRATAVRAVLERREKQASDIAKKYAAMAGLTVAISSSAMGDGIGMFFWKARLVHDTIKTYGFRPDAWSVARIYAYVLFASFLAASIEDLCEMLDVSELAGGVVLRVVQGVVGAAVVLKGGHMTRSYLTKGISKDSREKAIAAFRETAAEDLKAVAGSIEGSLGKIGLTGFGFLKSL